VEAQIMKAKLKDARPPPSIWSTSLF
jgi:hypothetical protein